MKKNLFLVLAIVLMLGCVGKNYYIVSRDVPQKPSFVVMPFNNYKFQTDAADLIENALLASGVKVLDRPATKEIETQKGASSGNAIEFSKEQGAGMSEEERIIIEKNKSKTGGSAVAALTRIERFKELEDCKADYIVNTSAESEYSRGWKLVGPITVRIVNKESRELLVAASVSMDNTITDVNTIIKGMGVPVKEIIK